VLGQVLVSGASGFIGSTLMEQLSTGPACNVQPISRLELSRLADCDARNSIPPEVEIGLGELHDRIDTIIHLAGRAHILKDRGSGSAQAYFRANRDLAAGLCRFGVAAGARRFVLISTIGVHGESPGRDRAITEESPCEPACAYAQSKLAGEQAVLGIAEDSPMEVTIIRPPLVYGPNAPGNFGRLVRLVHSGMPLPLQGINNSRSMIAVSNLTDFIQRCISHPAAADQTFLVSDGEDLSTPAIIREIADGLAAPNRCFPFPKAVLKHCLGVSGRHRMFSQLCENLLIDSSKARTLLDWKPPFSAKDALRHAARETDL
jgi:nucleoside-diphosphate-sugar epimerase